MEAYFASKELVLEYNKEHQSLISIWATDNDLNDKTYRTLIKKYIEAIHYFKPVGLMIDALNAKYAVPVETQDWINEQVLPLYEKYQTRYFSIVLSKDFVTQVSLDQIIDDATDPHSEVHLKYFEDRQTACDWLYTETKVVQH
ncbi:MAG: hypothetical protein AAGI07_07015 [Bacteroidota bacterium]